MKQMNLTVYKVEGLTTEKKYFNQLHNIVIWLFVVSGEIYPKMKMNCKKVINYFSRNIVNNFDIFTFKLFYVHVHLDLYSFYIVK